VNAQFRRSGPRGGSFKISKQTIAAACIPRPKDNLSGLSIFSGRTKRRRGRIVSDPASPGMAAKPEHRVRRRFLAET